MESKKHQGLPRGRLPFSPRDPVFLACLLFTLAVLALAFSGYQEHHAYSAYCKSTAHAGEQGCQAEKPFGESVFADPLVFFACITALFTGGLIVVGVGQAYLFWWQLRLIREGLADTEEAADAAKEQAKLARESLIASNRAWLQVEVVLQEQNALTFDLQGSVSVTTLLRIKNIGKEVALNIRANVWLRALSPLAATDVSGDFAPQCEKVRTQQFGVSLSLFPGESAPSATIPEIRYGAGVDKAEFEAARMPQDNCAEWLHLCLYGCVTYQTPSDPGGFHQTRFFYRLIVCSFVPFSPGSSMPANEIMMHADLYGGNQAD